MTLRPYHWITACVTNPLQRWFKAQVCQAGPQEKTTPPGGMTADSTTTQVQPLLRCVGLHRLSSRYTPVVPQLQPTCTPLIPQVYIGS